MKKKTLSEDFLVKPVLTDSYTDFTKNLFLFIRNQPLNRQTGDEIRRYALAFVEKHPLTDFKQYSDQNYMRNYIGRDPQSGWEVLIMNWKAGNTTAIHGHPQFAGYTFADGEFRIEIFEPYETGIRKMEELHVNTRESLYAIGKAGKFNNHIHRITCLSPTAHSLHIYSDDALKGLKYAESEIRE